MVDDSSWVSVLTVENKKKDILHFGICSFRLLILILIYMGILHLIEIAELN
jgi:hypothetical protein